MKCYVHVKTVVMIGESITIEIRVRIVIYVNYKEKRKHRNLKREKKEYFISHNVST